jgi:ubiquinone/menaquinone biosynthesis C-methylase UbiE
MQIDIWLKGNLMMLECLEDVLICPKTKNRVTVDVENSVVRVNHTNMTYSIKDGIIDFLPDVHDRLSQSYDSTATFYDGYITRSNRLWNFVTSIMWGSSTEGRQPEVLSSIPDDFSGVLLDVPVGTGIHTFDKYQKLEKARIIAIDYSPGMLRKARQVYAAHGLQNVTLIRGDVGNLPIADAKIDRCLSMSGFHAFPQKTLALREISRALKSGGKFTGSFYIKDKRKLSDLFVRMVLTRGGTFTPPFYNEKETRALFGEYFDIGKTANVNSFFFLNASNK